MKAKSRKEVVREVSSPPPPGFFKFNIDEAARGKPGPAGIGGVLRDSDGASSIVFLESVGVRDSNEVVILAIKKALSLCVRYG